MDDITKHLWEAGEGLRKFAKNEAKIAGLRGIVNELFPDIYEASKRMSTRAISRWLEEDQGVKLSPATISKALREPQKYWIEFFEFIEPYARLFAEAHASRWIDSPETDPPLMYKGLGMSMLLNLDSREFEELCFEEPEIAAKSLELIKAKKSEYIRAMGVLRTRWFALDEHTRDTCLFSQGLEDSDRVGQGQNEESSTGASETK